MTTRTCETCRAVEALIRGAGTTQGLAAAAALPTAADLEARVRALVSLKRAYEQDLPADDPDTVEHEHKRGIVVGLSIAITRIQSETGISVDDPAPPRTRRRGRAGEGGLVDSAGEKKLCLGCEAGRGPHTHDAWIQHAPSRYALSLLSAIARRHPRTTSDEQVAVIAGRSLRSSSFAEAMSQLREDGLVTGPASGRVATPAGVERVGRVAPEPTGSELLALWQARLERAEGRILEAIVDLTRRLPNDGARLSVSDVSRRSRYSETSSSFTAALGRLRRLGLVDGGSLRCATELI